MIGLTRKLCGRLKRTDSTVDLLSLEIVLQKLKINLKFSNLKALSSPLTLDFQVIDTKNQLNIFGNRLNGLTRLFRI